MKERNILITGASSGIGRAVALEYAGPGARLFLIGRDAARLEEAAQACRARGAQVESHILDVRDRAATRVALLEIDARHPLDLVLANAGISTGLPAGALAEDPEAVRAIVAINFLGVLNSLEPLIAPFCARGRGTLAATGSISALRGLPQSPAYCATKAGVHLYVESLRAGLRAHGVKVCLVVPGFVHTPLNATLVSPKPLPLTDAQAARIIRKGLDRGKPTIAFPKLLYWVTRLSTFLPTRLVDAVLNRQYVDAPVTRERVAEKSFR